MKKKQDNHIAYPMDKQYFNLDRNSALPLYYQLKEQIKESILNGRYKPNDQLPTEEELCGTYSISRPVVRQAYDALIKEDLIGRHKGRGTFVKDRADKRSLLKDLLVFSFEERITDLEKTSKIIKVNTIVDPLIASRLAIEETSELLHIVRIVHDLEYPVSMIESYLPKNYFFNIEQHFLMSVDRPVINLVETLYGVTLEKASRELRALNISKERAAYLHGNLDDLVYEVETKYFDYFGRIVVLEYVSYLTSKMSIAVTVNRNQR